MVTSIDTKVMKFQLVSFNCITEWNFTDNHDRQRSAIFLLVCRNGIIKSLYFSIFTVEDYLPISFEFNNNCA